MYMVVDPEGQQLEPSVSFAVESRISVVEIKHRHLE